MPNIPGVTYTGVITVRHLFNFGPQFDDGILSINPPDFTGPVYPLVRLAVDGDGNEIAGVRLPPVEAPIATTDGLGSCVRAAAFGGPDGCEASGQWIPFKTTKAERHAAGDPRKSLEERYKNHDDYVKAVAKAAASSRSGASCFRSTCSVTSMRRKQATYFVKETDIDSPLSPR